MTALRRRSKTSHPRPIFLHTRHNRRCLQRQNTSNPLPPSIHQRLARRNHPKRHLLRHSPSPLSPRTNPLHHPSSRVKKRRHLPPNQVLTTPPLQCRNARVARGSPRQSPTIALSIFRNSCACPVRRSATALFASPPHEHIARRGLPDPPHPTPCSHHRSCFSRRHHGEQVVTCE